MAEAWSFAGRVMVVTGAAQGVGEATARLMAERGAAGLALVDLDRERLAAVAAEIAAAGCPTEAVAADLAEVQQCFAAIDRAGERFGVLHGLVNAAGVTDRGTIDDTTPELFERIFAVDARAPFFLIQRILPWLRRAGGGTIVNVVSITVHGGTPQLAAYVAAKGALAAMTRNVAAAVAKDRVRVNGLNLGWTVTPNEQRVQTGFHGRPPDWAEAVGRSRPFGRLLAAEDAARAIAFLASGESALMTGALIDFEQQVMGAYPLDEALTPPTREPVAVGRSLEAARRLCEALAGVVDLPLAVQLWDGSMVPLGSGAPPDRFVAIRGPGVLGALLRRPSLDTLFRHYVRGDVEPHGTDLITLFGIVQDARKQGRLRLGGLRRRFPWGALPPLLLACEARPEIRQEFEGGKAVHQRKGRRAEELIQFHYDASNEFYALFLDEGMVYSCGYFTAWENSINEAQRDKLELICRKLRLRPGEALLDIGCGWGALVCHAARHHGVHAHGVTLSEAQCAYAQEKVARLGLADRVRVELRDYRSLEGRYDKIASVGMYEHVGIDSYPAYFRKVHKLLNDGGVFLNHGITRRAKRDERALRRASASRRVILKYIFPGAELDHVGHTLQVMENCGFEVHDVEGLRRHYARTCRLWHDRLAARREAAVPLVGPERYRMWAAYLAGVAIGFERGPLRLFQTVATKQGDAEGLPPTRADLYRRAGASGNLGARQPT